MSACGRGVPNFEHQIVFDLLIVFENVSPVDFGEFVSVCPRRIDCGLQFRWHIYIEDDLAHGCEGSTQSEILNIRIVASSAKRIQIL